MMNSGNVQTYLRYLDERMVVLRRSLEGFLTTIGLENREEKVAKAKEVLIPLQDLGRTIAENDQPTWLKPLIGRFTWYINVVAGGQTDASLHVLNDVVKFKKAIDEQEWLVSDIDGNVGIDFASIYDEYLNASRIPELFDELVALLDQVITSGEVDSLQILSALEKLKATLKKSSKGGYVSAKSAVAFAKVFAKNLAFELLEETPIGPVVKAFRKTLSDLDSEVSTVETQIVSHLEVVEADSLPVLKSPRALLSAPISEERN